MNVMLMSDVCTVPPEMILQDPLLFIDKARSLASNKRETGRVKDQLEAGELPQQPVVYIFSEGLRTDQPHGPGFRAGHTGGYKLCYERSAR